MIARRHWDRPLIVDVAGRQDVDELEDRLQFVLGTGERLEVEEQCRGDVVLRPSKRAEPHPDEVEIVLLHELVISRSAVLGEQEDTLAGPTISRGPTSLLVEGLDRTGQSVVHDPPNVRFVDAHAVGTRRRQHQDLIRLERARYSLSVNAEAPCVALRRGTDQTGEDSMSGFCTPVPSRLGRAEDKPRRGLRPAKGEERGRRFTELGRHRLDEAAEGRLRLAGRAGHDVQFDLGPIERLRLDDGSLVLDRDLQLMEHIHEDGARRSASERENRRRGTRHSAANAANRSPEIQVRSPEVMTPLTDAMSFVDHRNVDRSLRTHRQEVVTELLATETLGSHEQEQLLARLDSIERALDSLRVHLRTDGLDTLDPVTAHDVDLVVHESDQWIDHHSTSWATHRRELIDDALSRSSGKQHHAIASRKDLANGFELPFAKTLLGEHALQHHRERPRFIAGFGRVS